VAADGEGDDPGGDPAQGADDVRRLVDGVRDDIAARAEPALDEAVALFQKPVGLAHRAGGADEEVLDDQVEAAAAAAQVLQGLPDDELDPEAIVLEVDLEAGDPPLLEAVEGRLELPLEGAGQARAYLAGNESPR
jgi:hypothetical protein